MMRFVIITPGRSGSTFLAKTLNQHPQVHCEEEIFDRSVSDSSSFNAFVSSGLLKKTIGFFFNREKLSVLRVNLPLKMLITSFLRRKNHDFYGFKISLDQLFAYPQLFEVLSSYKVIYLTRGDKLRMVLSLLVARKRGNYERFQGSKVALDPTEVKRRLEETLEWERQCLERFSNALLVKAEELFEDQLNSLDHIRKHLGLNESILPVESKKAHPDSIADWVENFDEIENYL